MSMDRRTLLKGLAVAGAGAVAPVEASENYSKAPDDAVGMLYDATKCIGCQACVTEGRRRYRGSTSRKRSKYDKNKNNCRFF